MEQMLRQMAVCTYFADRLLGQLREAIPNLPATSGMMGCFRIPLSNGHELSVSIPSDKNRNLALTDSDELITVETALFRNNKLIYNGELGYSDVCIHDFDAQAILAEYERLQVLLSKEE